MNQPKVKLPDGTIGHEIGLFTPDGDGESKRIVVVDGEKRYVEEFEYITE